MNDLVVVLRYLGFRINYNKILNLFRYRTTDLNVTLNEMYAITKVTK